MTAMMVSPAARSVSSVAYSIAQLRLSLLFMVCAFLFSRAWWLAAGFVWRGVWCWWFSRVATVVDGGRAGVDGESCPVVAVFVVSLRGCEGELGGVSVDHDEDGVVRFIVAFVVVGCFDACVHDSGVSSAALERVLNVCYPVSAAASPASDEF